MVSLMVNKLGCRVTQLVGGACAVAGMALSTLTKEPWHAYVLFSVLTGV